MTTSDEISILALAVSVTAVTISALSGRYEKRRTIRSQLTEVLRQIAALRIEAQKLRHETQQEPAYASELSASFDQQQGVLLQQARYLADQIQSLVTSVDWTAIGFASALNSDLIGAETYYKRGIDAAAPDPTYSLSAMVAYAWFLFMQGRPEEAREQYKIGLSQRIQNDNFARYHKGRTYMFWGTNERDFAHSPTGSETAFENAASQFASIDIPAFRENALKELASAKRASPTAPSEQAKFLQAAPGQANT